MRTHLSGLLSLRPDMRRRLLPSRVVNDVTTLKKTNWKRISWLLPNVSNYGIGYRVRWCKATDECVLCDVWKDGRSGFSLDGSRRRWEHRSRTGIETSPTVLLSALWIGERHRVRKKWRCYLLLLWALLKLDECQWWTFYFNRPFHRGKNS